MPFQLYCRREDGTNVVERGPCYLPKHLAGKLAHELKNLGWYAAERELPDTFTDTQEIMLDPEVTWYTDTVTLVYIKRDKTLEERAAGLEEYNLRVNRTQRNGMLQKSDWTQLSDAPLTEIEKARWVTYRQALRNIDFAADQYIWPIQPSGDNVSRA